MRRWGFSQLILIFVIERRNPMVKNSGTPFYTKHTEDMTHRDQETVPSKGNRSRGKGVDSFGGDYVSDVGGYRLPAGR